MGTKVTPNPSSELSKKQQVATMFDNISGRYDLLNHFLSLNIDKVWRRNAITKLTALKPKRILDVATGTGDLAIAALKLNPETIIGIDISAGMLEVGKKKIKEKKFDSIIEMHLGDSEEIKFDDNYFDAITVGFGVRNYENLDQGLSEMYRVLKPTGMLVVLEFSKPTIFPVKQVYNFYFQTILPLWGRFISRNSFAYTYLPESVKAFPDGKMFLERLKKAGYKEVLQDKQTFGICSIYTGIK